MVLGASPTSRSMPDSAHYQAGKMFAGIPQSSGVGDALLEAKLRPLPNTVLVRSFRYVLRCETRGGALRSSAPIACDPQRPAREQHDSMAQCPAPWMEPRSLPLTVASPQPAARVRSHASRDGAVADGPDEVRLQACSRWIARRFRRKDPLPHPERKRHDEWTDGTEVLGVESGAAAMLWLDGTSFNVAGAGAGPTSCSHRAECIVLRIGLKSH
ncbi:hypothetical protein MOQ_002250 [Trypanosoma cruzi marinkellei]|uniref:Uncharacterized protein n=1 Tax=Trypanosoma cruzi marinkellei TaxID=85056 RepID=K2NQ37_TRYCR|nr:hypothetical protein MOQ_002250 [Trypanosoma cruzi marinkellei]